MSHPILAASQGMKTNKPDLKLLHSTPFYLFPYLVSNHVPMIFVCNAPHPIIIHFASVFSFLFSLLSFNSKLMINVSYCYGALTMMSAFVLNTLHAPHLIHVITLSGRHYFHFRMKKLRLTAVKNLPKVI